jgi:ABC-type transport system involved in multi-copper enzyme maturation permease subunit
MRSKNILFYEARIAFGISALLSATMVPAWALFIWLLRSAQAQQPNLQTIQEVFERFLPLAMALAASHVLSIERDERFDGLRHSYPESSWRISVLRLFCQAVLASFVALITALIFYAAHGPYDLENTLLPALPPLFYLMGLAMMVSNVSGNSLLPMVAVVGYWFFEYSTTGRHTGVLFLFPATMPNPDVDYMLNRGALVAMGCVFLGFNIFYGKWRRTHAE